MSAVQPVEKPHTGGNEPQPTQSNLRAITHVARDSRLEYKNLQNATNRDFSGFLNLIFLGFSTFIISLIVSNVFEGAAPLDPNLMYHMFSQAWHLLPSLFVLVNYMLLAFVLQKLVTAGYIQPNGHLSHALQHTLQSGLFAMALGWCWYMNWPMVQTAAFVMEMIVLYMKMHSYIATNRQLAINYTKRLAIAAVAAAAAADKSQSSDGGAGITEEERADPSCYPNNVTLYNFWDYLLIPTLVYNTTYPRTKSIRPGYLLERIAATIGTLLALYVTTSYYIIPPLQRMAELSFVRAIFVLITPFTVVYMLIFYFIFECLLNVFAELTRFADREFYQDWWNAVSFDEYARKWNRPVHEFLRRHIYDEYKDKIRRTNAMIMTFLFSSVLHELVLVMMFRMFRPYLLAMQMSQIPLIWLGQTSFMKNHPRLGNYIFWLGLGLGPALLAISYSRTYMFSIA